MSAETNDSVTVKSKLKKKSIIERELETSLTEKLTSPVLVNDKSSTSRYGRVRRSKTDSDFCENIVVLNSSKSPKPCDKSLNESTVHTHTSRSPIKKETPLKSHKLSLDSQIENIYNENQMMSRFASEKKGRSASIKSPKIYVRKDLIQRKEKEETITLIKNMFSPGQSPYKPSNSNSNYSDRSSEKYSWNKSHNGHTDLASVVKTLDFGSNKKKKKERDAKVEMSKSDLFDLEAKCYFQVGDLAWARIGTFPFWPCIVTRDPETGMFVKKKLFGKTQRDIINVTFCNDNGRRSWVVDNMLRSFKGKAEFMETREKFTPETKKKDPRLFAAFFVSDKKQHLWNLAIEEAETLLKEPKRFRIDLLNEMIYKARAEKFESRRSSKVTRTDSDVSLSESLYDSLFSEEDVKEDSHDRSRVKSRNKSFDVSDVVTACLDNMAAKTGITKIKKQSHMDRWLQKAKSKTPEKTQSLAHMSSQKTSENKIGSMKKSSLQSRSRSSRMSNRKSGQKFTDDTVINIDVSESTNYVVDPCNIVNESVENGPQVNGSDIIENVGENTETGLRFDIIAKVECLSDHNLEEPIEEQSSFDVAMVTDEVDHSNINSTEINNEQNVNTEKEVENASNVDNLILNNVSSDKNCDYLNLNEVVDFNNYKTINKKPADSPITELISDAAVLSQEPEILDKTTENNAQLIENTLAVAASNSQFSESTISNVSSYDDVVMRDAEKEALEQINEKLGNHDECSKIVNEEDNCNNSITDKSLQATVTIYEDDLRDAQMHSPKNIDREENTVAINEENQQNDPDKNKALEILTQTEAVENSVQNTSWDTVCEDVEMKDATEHNNDELSKKEEESSKDKTMNDLVNEIGCKKKTKDLQDMIFNASVAENNANQVNGTIESESKVSSNTTDIEKRLEKTFYQNKACEHSSPESTKIRKRFSLRRNNKDKINHLNEKSSYIKSRTDQITCRNVQITIEKNKEIDLYIQKSQGLVNIDKSNIEDQRSNEIVSNKKVKNIEEINIVQNSDERANPKNYLDFTLSNQSEESPNDNSRKVKNRDKKSNKSEIYMNGDTHMEFIENNVDFSENNPVSSKKKSKKVLHKKFRSTDLDSSQNGSSSSTTMSRKDKHNTDDLNSPEVEPNLSEITSKNHDQTSKDDLDSCENNLNLPKNTPKKVIHNEASVHLDSCNNKNSKSTELTDSASTELTADSIKLNITDVEVSISDGNIPKITPSVEITQKSLHRLPLSKLSRKVHEDDIDTLSLNSNASSSSRRSSKRNKKSQVTLASENTITEALKNPEFLKYTEMRQDQILDENPDLTQDDLIKYLYKTWLYEEEIASKEHNETRKNDMDFCENILNLPKNTSEKDIQNEISVNDLDSRNDKENSESTELIDSAKADSIKLNITDVEVSISDGNIPKITPSVEITQKSLHRLPLSKLSRKVHEDDIDTLSLNSNASSSSRRSSKRNKKSQVTLASENTITEALKNPEFVKYTEMRQDQILVENPDLTQDDLIKYLYKTWLYEEEIASKEHNETRKNDMDSCENILNLPKNTSEKDIQNEISLNDLDSRNDKENPESTELIDSAKADSIKLNITDVEVSISDGSIHKITPSVEITEKSDILNKKDNLDMLDDFDSESINSENSEVPLSKLSRKIHEDDLDTVSLNSNTSSSSRRSSKRNKKKPILESENTIAEALENPEFVKYMEMRQDQILDENPDLTQDDLIKYLYKTWLYEEEIASKKHSETRTNDMDSCENILNIPKNTSEKDIHNEISVNDLDSRNDKENSDSTELIDSAKADSIKLNITDVEVSISDGNIPKITPSVEITEISDVLNKKDNLDILDGFDSESINSENSEVPLSKLSRKIHEDDLDTVSLNFTSSSSRRSSKRNKKKPNLESDNTITEAQKNPEFVKYMEMRQDQILDKNPDLTQDDLIKYLYKTWLYEEELKSDRQKTDELESSKLVKGLQKDEQIVKPKRRVNKLYNNVRLESMSVSSDENETTSKRSLRSRTNSPLDTSRTSSPCEFPSKEKVAKVVLAKFTEEIIPEINKIHNECDKNIGLDIQINKDIDPEVASIDSENSDVPLIQHKLHIEKMATKLKASQNIDKEIEEVQTESKVDENLDALSLKSEESTSSFKKGTKPPKDLTKALDDPEFVKYLELRQDNLMDEHPELTHEEIVQYLHKTWLYEESSKSETMKIDEIEQLNLVKGLNNEPLHQPKKIKKKKDKEGIDTQINETNDEIAIKDKPRRKVAPACYNEEYFDLDVEEEIQYFDIFKKKPKIAAVNEPIKEEIWSEDASESSKITSPKIEKGAKDVQENIKQEIVPINSQVETVKTFDKAEIYFQNLTKPKPNVFKGMAREKVCEICSKPSQLVKCKGCFEMFHVECVKKETDMVDTPVNSRCRKKKKKPRGRKLKSANDSIESSSHSDEKYQGLNNSEDNLNVSIEDSEPIVADADSFETQVAAKMKEIMDGQSNPYMPKSNFQIDWATSNTGKCEIVDVKLIDNIDYSDFKCNSCQKCDTPVCFVCKSPVSPKSSSESRQKCQQMHCHKYYHLECLEHWPQAQFNGGELLKKKKSLECYEAVTCPRHVCHTCVSDDPRGCKTRFSADKLARCVRCPATYHTFTKCLPAGTQILTGSHIICPRHYEHRPGKVPCHVNTGWCFICALGGILICCEYCPTSFHADCLKISPPEGGYMCEDCETGRLPLYGEMVWVKLGLYRWWPGLILHPSEVPLNIMAVRHSAGEFVVRFFGQYDHYWVNRGRVFPFQEGDSGRISSQKSKIDAAFTMAMEHAQRACQILKNANLNQAELEDIASSLLPPAYVKLKVNKPCGSLTGRRVEFEESSLTQCECDPNDVDPCGPNSSCLNRMLLTECGPTCRAGERCQNRAFEKRHYPRLAPYRTPQRGWGLKTLEDIKMGQFVIEYVGELIDEEEFRRRMARMHDVRDENFYFLTLDKERMIDAGPKGNLARFMNHCCEPNCETQKWTVLADVRVGLFALRDIPAGSEVTFNYNFECAGIEKKRCLCGAKRCSGYIGAKPKQEESQPKKPRIPGVKRVYRKRKPEESPTITKSKVPKPRTTSRSKPKELTEIEKDLLIIKSATNGLSSDSEASGRLSSFDLESDKNQKLLKRKRVSFSTESEVILLNSDAKPPSVKRCKVESDKVNDVGD